MKEWIRQSARFEFKSNRSTGESGFFIGWFWIIAVIALIAYFAS